MFVYFIISIELRLTYMNPSDKIMNSTSQNMLGIFVSFAKSPESE